MHLIKYFESYSSQKDLEKLTSLILYKIAFETIKKNKNKIIQFKCINLGDIKFDNLNDFIMNFKDLQIIIISNDDIEGFQFGKNTRASYATYIQVKSIDRYIFIKENPALFVDIFLVLNYVVAADIKTMV
jgi:hypothetical protein